MTGKFMEGMYLVVKSRLSGLVLDVSGNDSVAGAELAMVERNPDNVNQVWYEDQVTGTMRSKHNQLCLTITDDNILTVDEYKEDCGKQEWVIAKDRIQSKNDPKLVLEISDDNAESGATLRQGEFSGKDSQLFDIEYLEIVYFHMVSEMHGKVVSVKDAERRPDAKIILEEKKPGADQQLWYEGKHGFVRSKLNNFVLESTKEDEKGSSIRLMPFEPGNTKQLWARHGNKIISLVHPKNLLAIKGKNKDNGAKLVINHDDNKPHQHWSFPELQD